MISKFILLPYEMKEEMLPYAHIVLKLIASYLRFIKAFNMKYIPNELYAKLTSCLQIVRFYISLNPQRVVMLLSESIF